MSLRDAMLSGRGYAKSVLNLIYCVRTVYFGLLGEGENEP